MAACWNTAWMKSSRWRKGSALRVGGQSGGVPPSVRDACGDPDFRMSHPNEDMFVLAPGR
jgi:hypothetical protein